MNRAYEVDVSTGLRDLGGNPTLEPIIVRFETLDTYVRPIQDINIDGELSIGSTVTLTPSFVAGYSGDGIIDTNDVARVEYQIGEGRLIVADEPPFSASFQLTLSDVSEASRLSVNATAFDPRLNSHQKSVTVDTEVDTPPTIEITSTATELTTRDVAQIYVKGFDDRCLGQLEFVFSGAFQYQEVYNWDTCSGAVTMGVLSYFS